MSKLRQGASVGATNVEMHVSANNGSTWLNNSYDYHFSATTASSASYAAIASGSGTEFTLFATPTDDDSNWGGVIHMLDPLSTEVGNQFLAHLLVGNTPTSVVGGGQHLSGSAINAIKFELANGGNFRDGSITLYGVTDS